LGSGLGISYFKIVNTQAAREHELPEQYIDSLELGLLLLRTPSYIEDHIGMI